MFYSIPANCVIGSLLGAGKDHVNSQDLGYFQRRIYKNAHNFRIFVDISDTSINLAVEQYPYLFKKGPRGITKAENSDLLFRGNKFEKLVYGRLPEEVIEIIKKSIK